MKEMPVRSRRIWREDERDEPARKNIETAAAGNEDEREAGVAAGKRAARAVARALR